jgi:hypothetical protein
VGLLDIAVGRFTSRKVDENGILVIGESYKLITFDAVADPSTNEAYQSKITSNKKENYIPTQKNESSSIHIANKEILIAALGGIIQQKTARLVNE